MENERLSYSYYIVKRRLAVFALFTLLLLLPGRAAAQVGDYRSELAVGVNGGYVLSSVGFNPSIPQSMMPGITGGVSVRYTCEKYFKSICALVAELNYVQAGWREDIRDMNDQPVVNAYTGQAEKYERRLTYLQLPIFARLGWGRERRGMQFFFQAGPQVGFLLGESTKTNFDRSLRNQADRLGAQKDAAQDTMAVENKFDYGIAAALGLEYSHPKVGHFLLEGRYYYGLGDIFGNSKRDYFGRSNVGGIVVKLTYLFDIARTKNPKIK